jgi:hypothetical protein
LEHKTFDRPTSITDQDIARLLAKGKVYRRVVPVKAVILTEPFILEQRDGRIVTAQAGDYLIQNLRGDKRPWVLPWDYFEAYFEDHEEGPEDFADSE